MPELYRVVIIEIHKRRSEAFAIHEVRMATGASDTSVTRVFKKLLTLGLLTHRPNSFNWKNYRVSKQWPGDSETAINAYEMARLMKA